LDIVETLRRAVERMYLGRLLPEERKERGADVLQQAGARAQTTNQVSLRTQLKALLEQTLHGETGIKVFEQKKLKRADILKLLVARAHEDEERSRFGKSLTPDEELAFRRERLRSEAQEQIALVEGLLRRRGLTPSNGDSLGK
jgi:hypothetical protein